MEGGPGHHIRVPPSSMRDNRLLLLPRPRPRMSPQRLGACEAEVC